MDIETAHTILSRRSHCSMSLRLASYSVTRRLPIQSSLDGRGIRKMVTSNELIVACVIGVPLLIAVGRLSTRVTWFHAKAEERYTLQEFIRGRE